ncbi:S1C family serine protease [Salirhabdus salicampi]|uniref:S1C family serine protease n=1 Tax=Salirhabdus salicampi TaxID=476102 RepID=UPI0020C4A87D|nr:trypsin-like peptidase domain-containing protein [Salirhabdus salicampi]MCP8615984.1 S1C family serine protease [Salirhabdus salicampi]
MKWIISTILTGLIIGAGVFGYFFVKDYVRSQLSASSTIVATEDVKEERDQGKTEEKDVKDVINEVQQKVVMIEVPSRGSIGSGFLYNDQGDILTNSHVVRGATNVIVKTADERELEGIVIGAGDRLDVAVIRVPALRGETPLQLANQYGGDLGDEVLALGSPLGLQNTVTTGIISGVERDFDIDQYSYENVFQISAPIAPGNSGGPLVLRDNGMVIGINSAVAEQGSIGFSIPIRQIIDVVVNWSHSAEHSNIPSISTTNNKGS